MRKIFDAVLLNRPQFQLAKLEMNCRLRILASIIFLTASGQSCAAVIASFDHHFAGGQSGPEFNYLDFYMRDSDSNSSAQPEQTICYHIR
jgi:hypothetical protein